MNPYLLPYIQTTQAKHVRDGMYQYCVLSFARFKLRFQCSANIQHSLNQKVEEYAMKSNVKKDVRCTNKVAFLWCGCAVKQKTKKLKSQKSTLARLLGTSTIKPLPQEF